jgi:hypothetical protein
MIEIADFSRNCLEYGSVEPWLGVEWNSAADISGFTFLSAIALDHTANCSIGCLEDAIQRASVPEFDGFLIFGNGNSLRSEQEIGFGLLFGEDENLQLSTAFRHEGCARFGRTATACSGHH